MFPTLHFTSENKRKKDGGQFYVLIIIIFFVTFSSLNQNIVTPRYIIIT